MLESMRRGQKWLTVAIVAVVGGVFVFFMGLGQPLQPGGPSQGTVVQIGDLRLGQGEFLRVRRQQADSYREQLGDQFDSKMGRSFLDAQALRALVDRAVLAHEARALGLRVGKEEIQRAIVRSPGFADEAGSFDREGFENWVEYEYGNQRNYIEYMKRAMLAQKMVRLLYSQGQVSEGEARAAALYRLQQVQIGYVAVDTGTLPAEAGVSDAEVEAYASEREAELRALYQERRDEPAAESQLQLRHILFELAPGATPGEEAAARAAAEAAAERIEAGESFATLAEELSDDSSTRASGGDLGLVRADEIAPELALAANALEVGGHSGPVRSDRGFHVVKLEERTAATAPPFEEVRLELAREGATARAAAAHADRVTDELSAAIRGGRSLEDAARERGLTLERTALLRRRADGFVVGLGASPEVLAMAFALTPEQPSCPEVFSVGSRLVLIQLLERQEPSDADLARALEGERQRLGEAKRDAFVQSWIDARRRDLEASGQLLVDESVVES